MSAPKGLFAKYICSMAGAWDRMVTRGIIDNFERVRQYLGTTVPYARPQAFSMAGIRHRGTI